MIGVYVDDLPLACDNPTWVSKFKSTMGSRFKTKDLSDLQHILGMHITRDRTARAISINLSQYLAHVLDKHGMTDCSPSALPMDPSFLATVGKATLVPLASRARDVYPILLGSLQYSAVCSRRDISTSLSILCSAHVDPSELHLSALKKVLRYLKDTLHMRPTLGGGRSDHSVQLSCYADAD
jgi:hypothetical protein